MKEKREKRFCNLSLRASGADDGLITGRIAYNSASLDGVPAPGCREIVQPGAFSKSLRGERIFCLWQHQLETPLASTANGTLVFEDTPSALTFRAKPDLSVAAHADAYKQVKSGLITDLSFGFAVEPGGDAWSVDKDGFQVRRLSKCKLFEVSLVSAGAYQSGTGVSARSLSYPAVTAGPQGEPLPPVQKMNPLDAENRRRLAEISAQLALDAEAIELAEAIRRDSFRGCKHVIFVWQGPGQSDGYFRPATPEEARAMDEQAEQELREKDTAAAAYEAARVK
jgi:HK97 family phage prohead protease